MTPRRQPAVFLDRDGTIIEDRGHLRSPADVVFFSDSVPALRRLQERFRLFIVTHQPGVSGGILTAGEVAQVNAHVVAELRRHGVTIDAVYCCPHQRADRCACIKPRPFFLEKAAREHNLDLTRSFVVGDHPHDVVLADHAGATGIYVLTGHGAKHRAEIPLRQAVAPGIREAVDWIFACCEMQDLETRQPGSLDHAAALLQSGGIVAFPTETVYGLGAAVFDETAVARVFEAKRRPRFDPLIVHVGGAAELPLLVQETPAMAQALMERFWPGPLTLVLPKSPRVPDLVTAGLSTVAVRMPRHPLALALIARAGTPIAAPSANPFGYVSPTEAAHVLQHLGDRVDQVLDGGRCAIGLESTVLSLVNGRPTLLRPGGIAREAIEAVIGATVVHNPASGCITSPGQTPAHYSPRTPILLAPAGTVPPAGKRAGRLCFGRSGSTAGFAALENLSPDGDVREAAIHLFAALHRLDALGLDVILADPVPETGLGAAVMDRLRRSAGAHGFPSQVLPASEPFTRIRE